MKVSGFSFVKNAVIYDYPIVEAINSILPICDEFVIAVGDSNDGTLELIRSIGSDKIRIIETVWDENMREGGRVLAIETDKAYAAISDSSDWAFYIQGDEVVHEQYLETIKQAMVQYKDDPAIDGLLLKYHHFFGSYDYVGISSRWYDSEVRVIKNDKSIYSYRDAQGFRRGQNEKLCVVPIDAYMNHYGWVKEPEVMHRKQERSSALGYNNKRTEVKTVKASDFDYTSYISVLDAFKGSHPEVMKQRIAEKNWTFDYDISRSRKKVKERFKDFCKDYFGLDFYYRNYKIYK